LIFLFTPDSEKEGLDIWICYSSFPCACEISYLSRLIGSIKKKKTITPLLLMICHGLIWSLIIYKVKSASVLPWNTSIHIKFTILPFNNQKIENTLRSKVVFSHFIAQYNYSQTSKKKQDSLYLNSVFESSYFLYNITTVYPLVFFLWKIKEFFFKFFFCLIIAWGEVKGVLVFW
jgi:hypothetical protein